MTSNLEGSPFSLHMLLLLQYHLPGGGGVLRRRPSVPYGTNVYLLNNCVKNHLISMIFGTQRSRGNLTPEGYMFAHLTWTFSWDTTYVGTGTECATVSHMTYSPRHSCRQSADVVCCVSKIYINNEFGKTTLFFHIYFPNKLGYRSSWLFHVIDFEWTLI